MNDNLRKPFEHIYVEEAVAGTEAARKTISSFPDAKVITIHHYKDLFNRKRQDIVLQHQTQNLILAHKTGKLLYDGAPVCQSFGNEHFYYTSCVMNCLYDCEYCYLKGMYPSGNLVIFLNIDDIFTELEGLLEKFPVYLCVSYDTDLLALENLTGFISRWIEFTRSHENLTIEVRTKCGRTDIFSSTPCERVIFAYTMSPQPVIDKFEHDTASLTDRIKAAGAAMSNGWPVRLCFDPMIYISGWQQIYSDMLEQISGELDMTRVRDFSIGSFRVSGDYLKNMRRALPESAVVQYPFELDKGYYHYPQAIIDQMEEILESKLRLLTPDARIFRWEET